MNERESCILSRGQLFAIGANQYCSLTKNLDLSIQGHCSLPFISTTPLSLSRILKPQPRELLLPELSK